MYPTVSTGERVRAGGPDRRLAWFHCFAGIAGDMALGSLLDAGAELDEVTSLLQRLPLGGWELAASPVTRGGIAATAVSVRVADDRVVRTHSHIVGILEEARLPERVRRRSLATFARLAEVEGRLHRRTADQVHFHEVGGHDAIIDIVGTAAALEVLGVDEVHASAVATGTGMVRSSHGLLPNPAPAVVELLRGAPTYGRPIAAELTTPTGAALLAANSISFGPLPRMTVSATGFGAGNRELADIPNCTQVVLGERIGTTAGAVGASLGPGGSGDLEGAEGLDGLDSLGGLEGQPMLLIETNLDDATGEVLSHAVSELLDAGVNDAWITPIVMKKGRPAHILSVLVDPSMGTMVRDIVRRETGTLGVRAVTAQRWPSPRDTGNVIVEGLPVRVKVSPGRVKIEQADAAAVASRTGLPLREVLFRAEQAWRDKPGHQPEGGTSGASGPSPSNWVR